MWLEGRAWPGQAKQTLLWIHILRPCQVVCWAGAGNVRPRVWVGSGGGANCGIVWITFATDISLLLFHMLAEGKAIPPQFGKTWKLLSRCCVPLALPNSLAFTLSPHPLNGSEVPHSHPYPKIFWQGQKSMHPSIHPSMSDDKYDTKSMGCGGYWTGVNSL